MREGLLWYDADGKRPMSQKVGDAARRYQERFGHAPNCCHVHPDAWAELPELHVVADPRILPHHFWIGVDETLPDLARPARRRKGAA